MYLQYGYQFISLYLSGYCYIIYFKCSKIYMLYKFKDILNITVICIYIYIYNNHFGHFLKLF